ncbi:Uncharacterised protein [Legionella steigerwaltii]|uniref:Uncharacterized protein n=1 Tax=Legionella steigerwaltii TaxID=460 RepID=A0A378L9W2_9GAMM|nr:hypothetical protein [Legionella steigerwaltii]KTD77433.1 hypothetical protein Lstg_1790 [Legionella steigerwaltii]STY22712.1 Uncharacterised protein [Legionella steigerwaltii]
MTVKSTFQGGIELNFSSQRKFESIAGVKQEKQAPIIARNAVRFLMMGWTEQWTEFLTPAVAYAVFVKRDHDLVRELRFAFQQGFLDLFEQLKDKELTPEQKEQVQLYLSNCLTLLPYGDLTPYEFIKIPQYIDGHLELVEYQIKPIELTERSGWRRFFIRDKDRVFAYGLEPILQEKAESHLIFMGTTYPAGQGFLPQVNTDSKGFETVGESLYRKGRNRIHEWLSAQKNKIHVCGVSLGGSLSLLLAIDKGNYIVSRVDALNPAGLNAWPKNRYDHWDELTDKPLVVVQKQGNDPVSAFGIWKNDWYIIQVTPPPDKQGPNCFCDHFLNYAGFADTTFTYIEAKQDNEKRIARNFWLYLLGRSLIYGFFFLPFTYAARPLAYFFIQNWMISVSALGILVGAGLSLAGILPVAAFLIIAGSLLATVFVYSEYLAKKNPEASSIRLLVEQEGLAEMHDPSLPRNPTMDSYNKDNTVEIELTYQQIHTYYDVMRRLVKEKDFLPDDEKKSKHVVGVSKKALLEESLDSQKAALAVPFTVTRAKAAHIRHTLNWVQKLGIENEALKTNLEKCYTEYRIGKHI